MTWLRTKPRTPTEPAFGRLSGVDERLWIVAYDISDPKRLYRVARRLQKAGERIQRSVFQCSLSVSEFMRLKWDLDRLIDTARDRVRCYPLTGIEAHRRQNADNPAYGGGYYVV